MTFCRQARVAALSITLAGVLVSAHPATPAQAGDHGPESPWHQSYPNVPGAVLLENDKVAVQRFIFQPASGVVRPRTLERRS